MIVRILPQAEEELYQAVMWYEDRELGLGLQLVEAYPRCVDARTSGHYIGESRFVNNLQTERTISSLRTKVDISFGYHDPRSS